LLKRSRRLKMQPLLLQKPLLQNNLHGNF
jgi:hypothetical protein